MKNSQWPAVLPRPGNRRLEHVPGGDPWFEVYRVSPDTLALVEPYHYEEAISYLILGRDRAVLLDTGMGVANLQAAVERLNSENLPVVVVNTHGHYDHVGDNHRFAQVWAFDDNREVAAIERGKSPAECAEFMKRHWYLELPAGFNPAAYEIRPSRVTRRLHHGEVLDVGGRTLTVHHTPGHSTGSICLLDSRHGLLFTGDTFYPGTMYAHFPESSLQQYRRSIDYLVSLLDQVSHLCPAHNEAYAPRERLEQMQHAFDAIERGEAPYELMEGARVYRFEGFGLMLRDPPAW
jgi:glyoxylase-like metal-dependent hydrolase (beta-lactamase superfamily II)